MRKYWRKAIARAKERGYFLSSQIERADNWTTCACGEQNRQLVDEGGEPRDSELRRLGRLFCIHILNHRPGAAKKTLCQIERHAAELLEVLA